MKTYRSDQEIIREAIGLAESWQHKANELLTKEEKVIQRKMKQLVTNPADKVTITNMMDQSFRSESARRIAAQVSYILTTYGIPAFFTLPEKSLINLFLLIGRHFPALSVPHFIERMRRDAARAIIPGEPEVLFEHLRKRKQEGVRMNINHLGEAVLGEDESAVRLKTYLEDLRHPEVEYISVKISTIYSQISSLAMEHSIAVLEDRLSQLYRAAAANVYQRADGTQAPKFVNLDMEEYRDLEITVKVFQQVLDQPEFLSHSAGIVLQAYIPDSWQIQQDLTIWAKDRLAQGGAPIKIRIVKGANLEMEQLEAALNNWPLATYDNKKDVDANFKRMVDFGCRVENMAAVHLGIASHNLFDLAYSWCQAKEHDSLFGFSFEMLEGMADHIRRAIQQISGDMLLYAPVASKDQFINAIAYLIRRLDENTAEENFLRHSFDIKPGSASWDFLKQSFMAACYHKEKAGSSPHRTQNRLTETFPATVSTYHRNAFYNEPDTDWTLPANRQWAENIRSQWMTTAEPLKIPVVISGQEITTDRKLQEIVDPSQLPLNQVHAVYTLGSAEDAESAAVTAKADPDGWRTKSYHEIHHILSRAAMNIRLRRGELIGAAAANTGKTFAEADPEISEAIDFVEFYPFSIKQFMDLPHLRLQPKGVGLVISPWNFPIAIPCGGITAALAAGNTVIFKPASDSVLPAWILCQCFWDAGVSRNTLQFIPCRGSDVGKQLVIHQHVDFIILTGGTDTGLSMLQNRPDIFLAAETGGKNAIIVTAMSDRDQAIKNILHSAFSNCGQKCSAASLAILEQEVFADMQFRKSLVDAVKSYAVGSAWEFQHKMGPLIKPPDGDLLRALTKLEPGEEWALKPQNINNNPYLWTPGIKWNVQPGSYTHTTEFFGPVLGVMKANNLDHAIQLVNQTGYGLTSGLESLDKREQEVWKAGIIAGNLYINRGTTGAIVLRQPFGGMRKSCLGAGIKAGGPNYVTQFMHIQETAPPRPGTVRQEHRLLRLINEWRLNSLWGRFNEYQEDIERTVRAVHSYLFALEQEFGEEKDYFYLRGQDNHVRYLPVGRVMVCLHPNDTLFDVLGRICAVEISGCRLAINIPPDMENPVTEFLSSREGKQLLVTNPPIYRLDNKGVAGEIRRVDRLRYAAEDRVPIEVFRQAAGTGAFISRTPVLMEGRIELLQYFREQAVCHNYHRYGNLGERSKINS